MRVPPSADPEPPAPGPGRIAAAILPLPFVASLLVPGLILAAGGGGDWELGDGARGATIIAALAFLAAGLGLFAATVRLFASEGRGTLAPWDPPKRLVVRGPYRYLRHPMITGVALTLAGEALIASSSGIALWLAGFVLVNSIYLPLVEEPALVRRFGAEYERYMANVPRLIPRLRPWTGTE